MAAVKKKENEKKIQTASASDSAGRSQATIDRDTLSRDIIAHIKEDKKLKVNVGFLDEVGANVTHWLDTGSYVWNFLGSGKLYGGLPYGRVIEYHGEPYTGKSLLQTQLAVQSTAQNNPAIYCDTELAIDNEFVTNLGGNPKEIVDLTGIRTLEDFDAVFQRTLEAIRARNGKKKDPRPILFVLDSVAMLPTVHELNERDKRDMTKPGLLRKFFRAYMFDCFEYNIQLSVVNQIYEKIGVMFGDTKGVSGGHGIPYSASIRFFLYAAKALLEDGTKLEQHADVQQTVVKAKTLKNRVSLPFRSAFIVSSYKTGINRYGGLFELISNGKWNGNSQFVEVTHFNILQAVDKSTWKWPGIIVDSHGKDMSFKKSEFEELFREKEEYYIEQVQAVIDQSRKQDALTEKEKLEVQLGESDNPDEVASVQEKLRQLANVKAEK